MLDKIARYWRTVKHLKSVQVRYQLYYRLKRLFSKKNIYSGKAPHSVNRKIEHIAWIHAYDTYNNGSFRFLNKTKSFKKSVNWNFAAFGALWTYNLTYFDYLLQRGMDKPTGLYLIHDFIENIKSITAGLDPYPISLRTMNWIKFCLKFNVSDLHINDSLYVQLMRLKNIPEYHLMGNHLLENGFALLIGGIYFEERKLLLLGQKILQEELDEQILADGGHFERSPMYHQILLSRLLDCCNLLENTSLVDDNFKSLLRNRAELMLGWLYEVTFNDGSIPHVNDATVDIAPTTTELVNYASLLGLETSPKPLQNSGYRMIKAKNYEWFIDVGDVGPDYIPGHAHSDTFSFVLHVDENPLIVDTGLSTYEEGERRQMERSTAAHNTVMVNGEEQTEVWKAFRVGRRAHITKLEEGKNDIVAEHDGYKHLGLTHRRTFTWKRQDLIIHDEIIGITKTDSTAFLHFYPGVHIEKEEDGIMVDKTHISFRGEQNIQIKSYKYASGFNRLEPSKMLEITFSNKLETLIKF